MEPIRVRRSLRRDCVRRIRACNCRSAHAATADPYIDATHENAFACLSYLCARAKLDIFVAALAQLLEISVRQSFLESVCHKHATIFFVHFVRFVLQLLALCEF